MKKFINWFIEGTVLEDKNAKAMFEVLKHVKTNR